MLGIELDRLVGFVFEHLGVFLDDLVDGFTELLLSSIFFHDKLVQLFLSLGQLFHFRFQSLNFGLPLLFLLFEILVLDYKPFELFPQLLGGFYYKQFGLRVELKLRVLFGYLLKNFGPVCFEVLALQKQ